MHAVGTDVFAKLIQDTGEVVLLHEDYENHDVHCDQANIIQIFHCQDLVALNYRKKYKFRRPQGDWEVRIEAWASPMHRFIKETYFGRLGDGFGGRIKGAAKVTTFEKATGQKTIKNIK